MIWEMHDYLPGWHLCAVLSRDVHSFCYNKTEVTREATRKNEFLSVFCYIVSIALATKAPQQLLRISQAEDGRALSEEPLGDVAQDRRLCVTRRL
jgi:hypothetical protein